MVLDEKTTKADDTLHSGNLGVCPEMSAGFVLHQDGFSKACSLVGLMTWTWDGRT